MVLLTLSCGGSATPPPAVTPAPTARAPVRCARDLGQELDPAVKRVIALRAAAWEGDGDRVRACLAEGADPNLAWPGAARWPETARIVLDAGASPHGPEGDPCPTCVAAGLGVDSCPLCDAARHGSPDVVALLIGSGADPDAAEAPSGVRPLHLAAQRHDLDVVRALLEAGADVNARDGEGRTALMYVVTVLSTDLIPVARLLLDAGADPAVVDAHGRRAVDLARETLGEKVGVVEALLQP